MSTKTMERRDHSHQARNCKTSWFDESIENCNLQFLKQITMFSVIFHEHSFAASSGAITSFGKFQSACSRWAERRTSDTIKEPISNSKRCVDIPSSHYKLFFFFLIRVSFIFRCRGVISLNLSVESPGSCEKTRSFQPHVRILYWE